MPHKGTRGLFNEVDTNNDGKIDRKEFSQWTTGALDEGVISSSASTSGGYYSRGSYRGTDASYDVDANTVYDQTDLNRSNVIARRDHYHIVSDENAVGDASSIENYVSTYATDVRGFYLDPDPEVFIRPDPSPAPTYTQTITIRYLQPPPLPPQGEQIIRELRPPPLQAPAPLLIREPGKPGYQPPALILRERPPTPPPIIRSVEKTVMLPPLPAPPRSTIIEKYPNLPDRPRDIILERWLPYEPRPPPRTVRLAAAMGQLPAPPRNQIIKFQPVEARIVRQFQRLGVTRADPNAYIREYGDSLIDSATFIQQVRSMGIAEDISVPAGHAISYTSSTYGHGEGLTGTYLGSGREYITSGSGKYSGTVGEGLTGTYLGSGREYITSGSGKYSGALGSEIGYSGFISSKHTTSGSGFSAETDAIDTAFRNADSNHDGTLNADEFDRFVHKGTK